MTITMQGFSFSPTTGISTETPVSIRIGSDVYAAKIARVTPHTIVVREGSKGNGMMHTFRFLRGSWRASRHYVLEIGECETRLDPSF